MVKLFQPPVTLTPQQMATAQRLFGKEAIVLERLGLQHPQIPNLYAYFSVMVTSPLNNQSEELFYLVQEFIDGEDLEKVLDRQGQFSETEVTRVLRSMLDILGFVHKNGAIHRDVKPSNIMQRQDGRLFLLDFGAVKEVTAPTGVQRGPTTICSPDYAPPEQIMNGTVDETSDLYALAATCVVLLTDKGSNELRDSISNRWRWQPHARVSTGRAARLDKVLQPNPASRFPTAKAVTEALSAGSVSTQISGQISGQTSGSPYPPVATPPVKTSSTGSSQRPATPRPVTSPPLTPQKASPPPKPVRQPPAPLSLARFLGNAAFSGAEGGLLAIAALSLVGTTLAGHATWLVMLAGLATLQFLRVIEGLDLAIIAGVTFAIVAFFRPLHAILGGSDIALIVVIALMAGGGMVAIAVIFRLIFRLLSRIM
ncbi:MAG: protein kinase [Phormidesmis sp.]